MKDLQRDIRTKDITIKELNQKLQQMLTGGGNLLKVSKSATKGVVGVRSNLEGSRFGNNSR